MVLYYKFFTERAGEKIENRSIFDKDMDKSLWFTILAQTVESNITLLFYFILFYFIYF